MGGEGYQGFNSSCFGVSDIHRLQDLSCREVRAVPQHEATFPIETVRGILQEVMDDDDPDQIALLWAAYLFGFNRSQVAGAEGAGDTVLLQFASAKERDLALEVYGKETTGN